MMTNVKHLLVNTAGNDYIVGDIHGDIAKVDSFLEYINFNPDIDRLISVGDVVDRGPSNLQAFELFFKPWFHAVRGNHEDMCMSFIQSGHPTRSMMRANGADWLLNIIDDTTGNDDRHAVVDFFMNLDLPHFIRLELKNGSSVGILHAEVSNLDRNRANDDVVSDDYWSYVDNRDMGIWSRQIWSRFHGLGSTGYSAQLISKVERAIENSRFLQHLGNLTMPLYSGHTPIPRATILDDRLINIDTGAYFNYEKSVLTFTNPNTNEFWGVDRNNVVEAYNPIIIHAKENV